jgi:hypothetical protein
MPPFHKENERVAVRIIDVAPHRGHLGRPLGQAIELALVVEHLRLLDCQLNPSTLVPKMLRDLQSLGEGFARGRPVPHANVDGRGRLECERGKIIGFSDDLARPLSVRPGQGVEMDSTCPYAHPPVGAPQLRRRPNPLGQVDLMEHSI